MSELLEVSGPEELKSACFTFLKPLQSKAGAMLPLKFHFLNDSGDPLLCHCDYAC